MNLTSRLVKIFAVTLGLTGLGLLFVPGLLTVTPQPETGGSLLLVQLLGAAFLGLASANWTARESILGGIYGRAVVGGNQTFTFIGTLVVISSFPENPSPVFLWVFAVLLFGMVLFSILQFRPSWLDKKK